jgi:hypothetical protein
MSNSTLRSGGPFVGGPTPLSQLECFMDQGSFARFIPVVLLLASLHHCFSSSCDLLR